MKRSFHCAWSKPGGYTPICYPNEVTPEMKNQWLAKKCASGVAECDAGPIGGRYNHLALKERILFCEFC